MKKSIYDLFEEQNKALNSLRDDMFKIERKLLTDLKQHDVCYTRADIDIIVDDIINALDKSFRMEGLMYE